MNICISCGYLPTMTQKRYWKSWSIGRACGHKKIDDVSLLCFSHLTFFMLVLFHVGWWQWSIYSMNQIVLRFLKWHNVFTIANNVIHAGWWQWTIYKHECNSIQILKIEDTFDIQGFSSAHVLDCTLMEQIRHNRWHHTLFILENCAIDVGRCRKGLSMKNAFSRMFSGWEGGGWWVLCVR